MGEVSSVAVLAGLLFAAAAGASAPYPFELSDEEWRARCPALVTAEEMNTRKLRLKPIHQRTPKYPGGEIFIGREGRINLLARIDTAGVVVDVQVLYASHGHFVPDTVAAIKQWRYPPPDFDGHPTCVEAPIEVSYCMTKYCIR